MQESNQIKDEDSTREILNQMLRGLRRMLVTDQFLQTNAEFIGKM